MNIITNRLFLKFIFLSITLPVFTQSNPDDYWLNNGFSNGETVFTNSGFFYDDGGNGLYNTGQDWSVTFCSENGNPITVEFNGFRTDYRGGNYQSWDYMSIDYTGTVPLVAYDDDTPQFSFTSPDGCIRFGFKSQPEGVSIPDSGWVAEISANPPPPNNDPCTATELAVGNVCSPSFFTNKGSWDTRDLGSPACHTFFGGDVWFSAVVPGSGNLKVKTFPGSLEYAIMVLYTGACGSLVEQNCIDNPGFMPTYSFAGLTPGETVYIRIFGDQAKSGTFGICATDPDAEIQGYTGPAGVGDEVSNQLWLRADRDARNAANGLAVNGESVQVWEDQSGNENDVSQITASQQPVFSQNGLNNKQSLMFDGTQTYLNENLGLQSTPIEIFSVHSFAESKDQAVLSLGNLSDANSLSIARENLSNEYYTFSGIKHFGEVLPADPQILFAKYGIASPFHSYELNGTPGTVNYTGGQVSTNGELFLGVDKDQNNFLNGMVAEVLIYSKVLNTAQKIIVTNYLSTKYNISIPNDYFEFDDTHPNDLAGIGRVDQDNIHSRAQSAGLLSIGGPSELGDNEFVLFAHDGNDDQSWTVAEIPDSDPDLLRIEREWKVDITGDGAGSLSISLDTVSLPELPQDYVAYNIMIDGDGDFTNGAVFYGLIPNGADLIANNIELVDGDYISVMAIKAKVNFAVSASEGLESIERPVIEVNLNYAVSEPVTVEYSVIGGTATGGGVDYSLNDDILVFDPGESVKEIIPLIIDDTIVEIPDEYFTIEIQVLEGNVVPGDTLNHTYTIIDNDISVSVSATDTIIGDCQESFTTLESEVLGRPVISYSWLPTEGLDDPASSSPVANPANTTTYVLTVMNDQGKTAKDSVEIIVVPGPSKPDIILDGETTFCEGDSIIMSGPDDFEYLWSNGDTTRSITIKQSGNYSLVVSEAGCESLSSDVVEITVYPLPERPVITPTGPISLEQGESVTLVSSVADNYLWSTSETTFEIEVDTSGEYSVIAISANGCESESSEPVVVTVSEKLAAPEITITGETSFCEGGSVVLSTAEAHIYRWSNGESTQSITVTESGSYTLIIENEDGVESEESDTVIIEVFDNPSFTSSAENVSCFEGTDGIITLEITGGAVPYDVEWSNGAEGIAIVDLSAGTYSAVIIDANGCINNVEVEITQPDEILVEGNSMDVSCFNGSDGEITLEISGGQMPYTVDWGGGETGSSIFNLVAGNYPATVTDANGCEKNIEFEIEQPEDINIQAEVQDARCPDASDGEIVLSVSGGTSPYLYNWSDGSSGSVLYNLAQGSYSVSITDNNNCSKSESFTVNNIDEYCFDIPDIITPNGDGKNDEWVIEGLQIYPNVTVEIYDRWGKRVFYSRGYDENFNGKFDGKDLPMDSYHYVIDLNNGKPVIIGNITIVR